MHYIEQFDLKDSISRTYFILLCLLPAAILGILAFIFFVNFLGTQSDEIARLVRDLEIQCESELGIRDVGVTGLKCLDYVTRIGLFFFLTLTWFVASTIMTVKIFEFVKSKTIRMTVTFIVAISLPALFFLKYYSAIGAVSSFLYIIGTLIALYIIIIWPAFNIFSRWAHYSKVIHFLFIFSTATFLIMSFSFAFFDKNLFAKIGTLNTILLSIILIYTFLGGLFYYSRTTGIPWVTGLLAWVLFLNITGLNDRAPVELRPVPETVQANQVTGDDQFVQWLQARQDRSVYETTGRNYPVYIIAAAGGGTYAAIRTAYMLTYLQKICPSFSHHIFAISGVSGGTLGAMAFASQQRAATPQDLTGCVQMNTRQLSATTYEAMSTEGDPTVLDRFFARDLLSTLVGAGLFPDMLQRILPISIRKLDRSVAYTDALGQYWRDALDANGVPPVPTNQKAEPGALGCAREAFFDECEIAAYWDPSRDIPIMIFNTTYVETGAPIVLSNLSREYYGDTLAGLNPREFTKRSIYLADAASLSARFPVALPAGFLPEDIDVPNWFRLVDGGYYDTSGLITAEAVKNRIEKIAAERGLRVSVRMIFLGEWYDTTPAAKETPPVPAPATAHILAQMSASASAKGSNSEGASEIGAHALALFKARDQRTSFVVTRFLETISGTLALRWDPFAKGGLAPHCQDVPLAWYLAPCTQQLARSRLDDALFAAEPELEKLRADLAQ